MATTSTASSRSLKRKQGRKTEKAVNCEISPECRPLGLPKVLGERFEAVAVALADGNGTGAGLAHVAVFYRSLLWQEYHGDEVWELSTVGQPLRVS